MEASCKSGGSLDKCDSSGGSQDSSRGGLLYHQAAGPAGEEHYLLSDREQAVVNRVTVTAMCG